MRVLRHWQGRGTLSASGSSLLSVGYYCQEVETTPQELRPPLLEVNGTITSDDAHSLLYIPSSRRNSAGGSCRLTGNQSKTGVLLAFWAVLD
jgi:hypothetical protein